MVLVDLNVTQTCINLHLDKSLRQLSSCKLANKRIHAYRHVIAMCVVHPTLLILALLVMLRIRSKSLKFKFPHLPIKQCCSSSNVNPLHHNKSTYTGGSKDNVMETTKPPLAVETTVVVCVYAAKGQMYLLVVIRQRLLRSGDVELNPGPLDMLDLRNVTNELSSVIDKWFRIGVQLGIDETKLNQIEADYRTVDRYFSEVINFWLKGNTQVAVTWKSLVEVLEAPFVNEKGLARRLREKGGLLEANEVLLAASVSSQVSESVDTSRIGLASADIAPEPYSSDRVSETDVESDQESSVAVFKSTFTFPFLDLTKLSKEEKQHLHQRLYTESMNMTRKFQNLFSATTESLKRQKISVMEIVCHLVGLGSAEPTYEDLKLPAFRHQFAALRKANTIDDAMVTIGNYCSFFNYHMIEHIIKKLGTRQDRKNLAKYKEEFARYAERHVFECPSEVGTVSEGLVNMFVTLDQTFDSCTVRNLELFVHDVQKILNITTGTVFKLCRIDPGSLKLTFQVSSSIFRDVFPLSDEQQSLLSTLAMSITVFSCGIYIYQFKIQNAKEKEGSIPSDDTSTAIKPVTYQSVEKHDDTSSTADSGLGSSIVTGATDAGRIEHDAAKLRPPNDHSELELNQAALRGELDDVKLLVEEKKLSPLQIDNNGNNALPYAAAGGHLSIMKYFVEDRALNPACLGQKRLTPLHYAAYFKHIQLVQYLVGEQQVNPLCQDDDGCKPLHRACEGGDIDVVQYLIKEMKKCTSLQDVVYDRTKAGDTAVHIAALEGHLPVIKLFISEWNFDPNTSGQWDWTLLHHAAQGGHLDIVKFLVEKLQCDPAYAPGEDKVTPLHRAAKYGHLDIIKYLTLQCKCSPLTTNSNGDIPLNEAALNGRYEAVKFFTSVLNCDANTPGWRGRTPLHYAAQGGHSAIVKHLIEVKKCSPATLDDQKTTPLQLAIMKGQLDIVKYLIDCNPLCDDKDLGIPLYWATYSGQLEIVKYFVEARNCPLNIKGHNNTTPLELARNQGHSDVVEYLVSFMTM